MAKLREAAAHGQRYDFNTPRALTVNGRDAGIARRVSVTGGEVTIDAVAVEFAALPEEEAKRQAAELEEARKYVKLYRSMVDSCTGMIRAGGKPADGLPDIRKLCVQAWHDTDAVWPLIDKVLETRERTKRMRLYRWETKEHDRRPYRTWFVFSDLDPDLVVGWLDGLTPYEACSDYSEGGRFRMGGEWKDYPLKETLSDFFLLTCANGMPPWREVPTAALSWLEKRISERMGDPDDPIHKDEALLREKRSPTAELNRRDWETDER